MTEYRSKSIEFSEPAVHTPRKTRLYKVYVDEISKLVEKGAETLLTIATTVDLERAGFVSSEDVKALQAEAQKTLDLLKKEQTETSVRIRELLKTGQESLDTLKKASDREATLMAQLDAAKKETEHVRGVLREGVADRDMWVKLANADCARATHGEQAALALEAELETARTALASEAEALRATNKKRKP